jgi:hypothetical protein
MNHEEIKQLIALYHDGELTPAEKKAVEEHIQICKECRREFKEMEDLEDVMDRMSLKPPPKEAWENYWDSIYNRLERQIGWIFLSIGAIIFLFYGGYKLIENILRDPGLPLLMKIGILAVLGGVAVLLVSLAREQIFVHKRERYKEVQK